VTGHRETNLGLFSFSESIDSARVTVARAAIAAETAENFMMLVQGPKLRGCLLRGF
jgi:hypothetical protein